MNLYNKENKFDIILIKNILYITKLYALFYFNYIQLIIIFNSYEIFRKR